MSYSNYSFKNYFSCSIIKRILSVFFVAILCSASILITLPAQATETTANHTKDNGKILIVYYSLSGNTADIAQYIQNQVGGKLVQLETVNPYPQEFNAARAQVRNELNDNYFPPLKTHIDNIDDYDVIFIGSPNWWGTLSMPIRTFLNENNLNKKTVIPFITYKLNGVDQSIEDLVKFAPNAIIREGLAIKDSDVKSSQSQVQQWLKNIGY